MSSIPPLIAVVLVVVCWLKSENLFVGVWGWVLWGPTNSLRVIAMPSMHPMPSRGSMACIAAYIGVDVAMDVKIGLRRHVGISLPHSGGAFLNFRWQGSTSTFDDV